MPEEADFTTELVYLESLVNKGEGADRVLNKLEYYFQQLQFQKSPMHFLSIYEIANKAIELDQQGYAALKKGFQGLKGKAGIKLYEIGGRIEFLIDGIDFLRKANKYNGSFDSELAIALVRGGEQTGNIQMLREALEIFDGVDINYEDKDYHLINAKAVANLRIGTIAQDGKMIEDAILSLQSYLKSAGLSKEAWDQTFQNLSIALLENARQYKSVRIYEQLISILEPKLSNTIRDKQMAMYTHVLGTCYMELSELLTRPSYALKAIGKFKSLVHWHSANPKAKLEALHSLGQANFKFGKLKRDPEYFTRAISYLKDALSLTSDNLHLINIDSRRHRLIADLGAYTLAMGWYKSDDKFVKQAIGYYNEAIELISQDRAPGLYAKVLRGLFILYFEIKNWRAAIEAYGQIEETVHRIEADPQLTIAVYSSLARDQSGILEKYALCLLKTGKKIEAAVALENGRGRRILHAYNRLKNSHLSISKTDQTTLKRLESNTRMSLQLNDNDYCRRAWEELLTFRRSIGFDLGSPTSGVQNVMKIVPKYGAYVQLTFSKFGSHALIWISGLTKPRTIQLPTTAFRSTGALFHGSDNQSGWIEQYRQFLTSQSSGTDESGRLSPGFKNWSEAIDHCLTVIGKEVMEPLHSELLEIGLTPGAKVVINPPGDLALLPFMNAALSDQTYFSDHWVVSITPNAAVIQERNENRSLNGPLLCIYDPDGLPTESDHLPLAKKEGQKMAKHFSICRPLTANNATVQNVRNELGYARFIHIACHGIYEEEKPDASGIELAGGARLTISQLYASEQNRLQARLLFLSSCEAGMTGRTIDYNEFVGLPGAFMRLGVHNVIAPLWSIYDDLAAVFSQHFYKMYLNQQGEEQMSPGEALRLTIMWIRNVQLGSLVDEDYLTIPEARACLAISSEHRLRVPNSTELTKHEISNVPLKPEEMSERPFKSPHDWAAFVMMGA